MSQEYTGQPGELSLEKLKVLLRRMHVIATD